VRGIFRHALVWALALALTSAGLAYWGFNADTAFGQVATGALALVLALAYVVAWRRFDRGAGHGWWRNAARTAWRGIRRVTGAPLAVAKAGMEWRRRGAPLPDRAFGRRLLRFLALVVTSAAAFAGGLIGAAVVLGRIIANDTTPMWIGSMYIGLAVVAAAFLALVTWWARSFARVVRHREEPSSWFNVAVGLAVLSLGLAWLSLRDTPGSTEREVEQARQAGAGRFDLVLVVDPADRVGGTLIQAAREALTSGDPAGLFAGSPAGAEYDVALGLAVPRPPAGGRPLWRLVEPPTGDYSEVAAALARIRPRRGPPAARSYGRLLADTLIDGRVRWRASSQLGVAFLLESLPALRELDGAAAAREPVGRDCPTTEAPEPSTDAGVPVAWAQMLSLHCRRREAYAAWEDAGRPDPEVARPVAVHAVTSEVRRNRDLKWREWIRALDGGYHSAPAATSVEAFAESVVRVAADTHVGLPADDLAEAALWFRPHLFFDDQEKFLPIDVDWLFAHPPEADEDGHRVCDHELLDDNCRDLRTSRDLVGELDEYIDFAGGVRFGQDLIRPEDAPPRMYVHVRRQGDRVFLGYWWYLEYNVSPWRREVNCLPGLTFAELSCHDHEGDWEGVTVELAVRDPSRLVGEYALPNLEPKAVVYAAHSARVRWLWKDVELAAEQQRWYATHPVVYVATGSHAAYPARCLDDECDQRLAGLSGRPEGGFDGGQDWPPNVPETCSPRADPQARQPTPCLVALPSTRDGKHGLLWNAFPGRWGRANCTVFAKVCSQTDGPKSPSLQTRFDEPTNAKPGDLDALAAMRKEHGMEVGMDVPRLPEPEQRPSAETPEMPMR
jgi:hypothetical protein